MSTSIAAFDLEAPWRLGRQVALRREHFGALAYHFGTRRLSFINRPELLCVVESLGEHASARAACRAAGVPDAELPRYADALQKLAAAEMIEPAAA